MDWLNELFKDKVFQTVVSGTLVFTVGQIIQKFVLEPIQNYKKVVGQVDNKLKYYANSITSSGTIGDLALLAVLNEIRQLSCDLESSFKQVPFTTDQEKRDVAESARWLIYLSNAGGRPGNELRNDETINRIRSTLRIEELRP